MKSVFVFFIIFVFGIGSPESYGQSDWIWLSDFSGGLNLVDAPTQLKETEALVLRNAVIDSKRIQKRKAFTQASAKFADDGVRALYRYYNGISKEFQIIAIAGNAGYVSVDDGVTFAMFYTDSGVTVTNGSSAVVAPDSGFFRSYRDLYMSGWKAKLPNGIYTVSSFGISGDTDPDTMYLETAYTGSNGSAKALQLSPTIASGYVDFETWLNRLYIADGFSPIKVWDGHRFRGERAKRGYAVVDSFKATSLYRPECNMLEVGCPTPTDAKWNEYADAHYCLVYSDSVGTGEEVSKPIPIATISAQKLVLMGLSRWDIDTTQYVFVTWPAMTAYADYEVVDSGSFERVVKVDSNLACQTYDYVDNDKSWSAIEYNYDNTMIVFSDPETEEWYTFRNIKRASTPDTVSVRISYDNAYIFLGAYNGDQNLDSSLTRQPRTYKIIRLLHANADIMPSSRFVRQQANVLWCAGFTDAPSQVWVSEPGLDSVFGSFIFDALGWDGDEVTQLFDIYNYIYAVKSNAIVQIQGNGNANFSQSPVVYDYGLKSSQSMFNYRNGFVGYNEEGFFLFNGGQPQPISDKIFPSLRDSINQQATAVIDGVDAGRYFVVACPFGSSTVSNRSFTFDLQTGSWGEWTGQHIGAIAMNNKVASGDTLIYADADSGVVYVYGRNYSDRFDLEYVSPFITGSDPSMEKQTLRYLVEAGFDYGDSVEVSFYVNDNLSTIVAKDTLISSTPAYKLNRYIADCNGSVIGSSVAIGLRSMSLDTISIARIGLNVSPIREIRQ